jgi:hypothetical protein
VLVLAGCAGQSVEPTATLSPIPATATTTTVPLTLPPTETVTPTALSTDTPQPVATLGPEQPATSISEIVGAWAIRLLGEGGGDPAVLAFKADGTYSIDGVGGDHEGMNIDTGLFSFEAGNLKLDSKSCYDPIKQFHACNATYSSFVSLADGKPGTLRLVAIEDPYTDRNKSLNGKTFKPALSQ